MSESLDLILKYPLIKRTRINKDKVVFEGKIFLNGKDYDIMVTQTENQENPNYNIDFNTPLFSNLKQDESLLKLLKCTKFNSVMHILDTIKECIESKSPHKTLPNYSSIYRKVLYEYSEFTKFFLNLTTCSLSSDLTQILASTLDEKNREHHVVIKVNNNHIPEETFEIKDCDLPGNKEVSKCVFKSNGNLIALFDEFLARLEYLQPYFDLMDMFDNNCTILDPEMPKRCHSYRRVWLGENLSIMITVDPEKVSAMPDIKFLGLERIVDDIRTKLNDNLASWDPERGPFQSLLDILDLERFPQKLTKDDKVYLLVNEGECSICFCQRLNEKLPEILCKNPCCQKFYHAECLSEWLISINCTRVFNEICGKCPNCEKTITCPIP